LIQALKEKTGLTRIKAAEVVGLFFSDIAHTLVKNERVEIRGFCTFHIKEYEPYIGRNPKTRKKDQVPGKKLPFFKCGKNLKERVNS